MKTFYVKMKCNVSGQVTVVPVLASTLYEAKEKAKHYPYNDTQGTLYTVL